MNTIRHIKIAFILFAVFLAVFFFSCSVSEARSGCCSWHGGVCGCNTSTGSQLCCDGTDSPSCGCTYIPPTTTTRTPVSSGVAATNSTGISDYGQCIIDKNKCENEKRDISDALISKSDELAQSKLTILEKDKQLNNRGNWLWILGIGLFISFIYKKSK